MNVASRLPDSAAARLRTVRRIGQAAFLGFGLGLRHQHYDETRQSADRLVRGHQRKLHAARRPAAAHARPDLRTLSRGDARRIDVDRLHRAAEFRISASPERTSPGASSRNGCRTICAGPASTARTCMISADPLQRSARSRRQPGAAGAGFLGRAIVLENVSTYVQFSNSNDGMGIPELSRRSGCCCCSTSTTSMSAPSTTATIR